MTSPGRFDLHTHSVRSDGHHTPREVVELAHGAGLDGVALTDHDTGDGLTEALQAGDELGLEVIPGTEFSAELGGRSVHVLAYWHDHTETALAAELLRLRDARSDRALRMVENFNALGVPISFARVLEIAAGAPVGRPHLAQAVVEVGACADEREVFERYLADGGPADAPKHAVDPVRAVELLRGAGGVVVLAHPALFGARDGGAERGGGVGREERVAGARREDDDPPLLEVPHHPASNVRLGEGFHADRGHHAGLDVERLEDVLQCECIDDRGQHPHVIGRDAVEPFT